MGEPTGGVPFNLLEFVLSAVLGVGGGLIAMLRAAVLVGRAEEKVEGLAQKVAEHADAITEVDQKNDARHEQNQRSISAVREAIARLPDKEDLRRIEDLIRNRFYPHN